MTEEWVRPAGAHPPVVAADIEVFKSEIERVNAKSILEFGPGDSTQAFLELGVGRIVTCEHKDKWRKVAQKRFKKEPRVEVHAYSDTVPVVVTPDLGGERFDLALVDSPQGFYPMRKAHPGMEDCSRLNTCLFALEHAKVVLLHDAFRPLERGTLGRLNALGFNIEFVSIGKVGIARIEHRELHDNGPSASDAPQSGSVATGSKPKRRRKRVGRSTDRLSVCRSEEAQHSGRSIDGDQHGVSDPARPHRSERSTDGVRSDERDGVVHAVAEIGARPS